MRKISRRLLALWPMTMSISMAQGQLLFTAVQPVACAHTLTRPASRHRPQVRRGLCGSQSHRGRPRRSARQRRPSPRGFGSGRATSPMHGRAPRMPPWSCALCRRRPRTRAARFPAHGRASRATALQRRPARRSRDGRGPPGPGGGRGGPTGGGAMRGRGGAREAQRPGAGRSAARRAGRSPGSPRRSARAAPARARPPPPRARHPPACPPACRSPCGATRGRGPLGAAPPLAPSPV
mmetsp:Transcript_2956/g.9724  ORF Transcript_2956/g.9724 Transcript_2956/m.9724 type:complete len:237 (+) Transcript_2956:28-738(+)